MQLTLARNARSSNKCSCNTEERISEGRADASRRLINGAANTSDPQGPGEISFHIADLLCSSMLFARHIDNDLSTYD